MENKRNDVPYTGVSEREIRSSCPELNSEMMDVFSYYLIERYAIRSRKDVARSVAPWTYDPILQKYRFTNVRREHDKQTRWVINNITSDSTLSYEDKLLNCILFRLYNIFITAKLIGMPIRFSETPDWDPRSYEKLFKEAKERTNRKFFTGAFSMSGLKKGLKSYVPDGEDNSCMEMRPLWLIRRMIDDKLTMKINNCWSPMMICSVLARYKGIQEFFAYQIFVDFTYIREFPYSENEYTIAGPGCKKGIEYLFKDTRDLTYEECIFWLRDYLNKLPSDNLLNPETFFFDLLPYDQKWNVMCLENCLCEFSKYIRILTKTGKPRAIYKGGT